MFLGYAGISPFVGPCVRVFIRVQNTNKFMLRTPTVLESLLIH